jgi:hypothetical protein
MSYYNGNGDWGKDEFKHNRPTVEDILNYPCPRCGAAPQQWCTRVLGKDLADTERNRVLVASRQPPSHFARLRLAQGHDDRNAPAPRRRGNHHPGRPSKRTREAARHLTLVLPPRPAPAPDYGPLPAGCDGSDMERKVLSAIFGTDPATDDCYRELAYHRLQRQLQEQLKLGNPLNYP